MTDTEVTYFHLLFISGSYGPGFFWFRAFSSIGVSFVNRDIHQPLFSERENLRSVLRVGKWSIMLLKPWSWYVRHARTSP